MQRRVCELENFPVGAREECQQLLNQHFEF
jgi:hypothetical protein